MKVINTTTESVLNGNTKQVKGIKKITRLRLQKSPHNLTKQSGLIFPCESRLKPRLLVRFQRSAFALANCKYARIIHFIFYLEKVFNG